MKFLTKERLTPKIIKERPNSLYGRNSASNSLVKEWAKRCRMGQELLDEDDERPGRPVEVVTKNKVALVEELFGTTVRRWCKNEVMSDIGSRTKNLQQTIATRVICNVFLNKADSNDRVFEVGQEKSSSNYILKWSCSFKVSYRIRSKQVVYADDNVEWAKHEENGIKIGFEDAVEPNGLISIPTQVCCINFEFNAFPLIHEFYSSRHVLILHLASFRNKIKSVASVIITDTIDHGRCWGSKIGAKCYDIREAQQGWSNKYQFPCAFGAIDCTYPKASEHGGEYYNSKGYFSINVQATYNAKEEFTSIDAQRPASVHDNRFVSDIISCAVLHNISKYSNDPVPVDEQEDDINDKEEEEYNSENEEENVSQLITFYIFYLKMNCKLRDFGLQDLDFWNLGFQQSLGITASVQHIGQNYKLKYRAKTSAAGYVSFP
nr:unnamed protein product [Callosobruchus analis]